MKGHFEHGPRGWSPWRHVGPQLIDGWPWGWGADATANKPTGWRCPTCNWRPKVNDGGPLRFGDELICPACARARCLATFDRCRLAFPIRVDVDAHEPASLPLQLALEVG